MLFPALISPSSHVFLAGTVVCWLLEILWQFVLPGVDTEVLFPCYDLIFSNRTRLKLQPSFTSWLLCQKFSAVKWVGAQVGFLQLVLEAASILLKGSRNNCLEKGMPSTHHTGENVMGKGCQWMSKSLG